MLPAGFEPTIAAGKRPKIYALDRAATGTGRFMIVSGSILLIVRNLSDESCTESQYTHYVQ